MSSPTSLQPLSRAEAVRGIFTAVILSFLTCGIYGLYWQYTQFRTVNSWLGREEHSFVTYLLLTVVTCGIYGLYYEYKFAQSMCEVQRARGLRVDENLPLVALVLGLCGLAMVTWCIEQNEINRWYGASVD